MLTLISNLPTQKMRLTMLYQLVHDAFSGPAVPQRRNLRDRSILLEHCVDIRRKILHRSQFVTSLGDSHWTLSIRTQSKTRRLKVCALLLQTARIGKDETCRFSQTQRVVITDGIENSQSLFTFKRNSKLSAHLARARM